MLNMSQDDIDELTTAIIDRLNRLYILTPRHTEHGIDKISYKQFEKFVTDNAAEIPGTSQTFASTIGMYETTQDGETVVYEVRILAAYCNHKLDIHLIGHGTKSLDVCMDFKHKQNIGDMELLQLMIRTRTMLEQSIDSLKKAAVEH